MEKRSVEIHYNYIEETMKKYIEKFNATDSEKEKDEIWWEMEPIVEFLKGAGIDVKIYENWEGDKWEFGYVYEI